MKGNERNKKTATPSPGSDDVAVLEGTAPFGAAFEAYQRLSCVPSGASSQRVAAAKRKTAPPCADVTGPPAERSPPVGTSGTQSVPASVFESSGVRVTRQAVGIKLSATGDLTAVAVIAGLSGSGTLSLSDTPGGLKTDPTDGTFSSYPADDITGSITGGANMGTITGVTTGDQTNNQVTPNAPNDVTFEGRVVDNFGLDIAFTDGIYNLSADAAVPGEYVLAAVDGTTAATFSPVTFALTPELVQRRRCPAPFHSSRVASGSWAI